MTERTAFFDGDIGPERYRLTVPPLAFAEYTRVQKLMLGPLRRRPSPWPRLIAFLVMLIVAAGIGVMAADADLFGTLVIGSTRFGWVHDLSGFELLLGAFAVFVLVMLLLMVAGQLRHRRLLRRFHATSRVINSPHELVFGETGLVAATPLGRIIAPWRAITAYVPGKDMHYVVVDRLNALWIPESVIAGRPDRDALLAFLSEKAPTGGGAHQEQP